MEMLSIMAISERQGFLLIGGKEVTLEQLAVMAGCPTDEAKMYMQELESAGVFSRDEKGVPFCRRMVKEYDNFLQGKRTGILGGNPALRKKKKKKKKKESEARSKKLEAREGIRQGLTPPRYPDWKTSFESYKTEENKAYSELLKDHEWLAQMRKFNPGVDIPLTLEKAHATFWGTEAGWQHKKSKRSSAIDWKRTFTNAIPLNRVWLRKDKAGNVVNPPEPDDNWALYQKGKISKAEYEFREFGERPDKPQEKR